MDVVGNKLVYGESISQTNQFMTTGAAPIGFTALSTLINSPLANKGHWLVLDPASYTPIEQGILRLDPTPGKDKASQSFFNFIFSDEAQEILEKYGYSVHE